MGKTQRDFTPQLPTSICLSPFHSSFFFLFIYHPLHILLTIPSSSLLFLTHECDHHHITTASWTPRIFRRRHTSTLLDPPLASPWALPFSWSSSSPSVASSLAATTGIGSAPFVNLNLNLSPIPKCIPIPPNLNPPRYLSTLLSNTQFVFFTKVCFFLLPFLFSLGIAAEQGTELASVDAGGWCAQVHSHAVSVPAFKARQHRCHRGIGEAASQTAAATGPFVSVISFLRGCYKGSRFRNTEDTNATWVQNLGSLCLLVATISCANVYSLM